MNNQLTNPQQCVLLRGGVELWIDTDRVSELENALKDATKRFLKINGQLINTFEVTGVFTPQVMDERTRRKNGQWTCKQGAWHDKGQVCECKEYTETVVGHVEGVGEVVYRR